LTTRLEDRQVKAKKRFMCSSEGVGTRRWHLDTGRSMPAITLSSQFQLPISRLVEQMLT